jgi:uncharacterized protein
MELALGMHAANNLFIILIGNHPNPTLPTQAIWQVSHADPLFILISFVISAAVFYWLLLRRPKRPAVDAQATPSRA